MIIFDASYLIVYLHPNPEYSYISSFYTVCERDNCARKDIQ